MASVKVALLCLERLGNGYSSVCSLTTDKLENRFVAERFHSSDFSRTGNDEAVVLCRWVNEPIAVSDECLIVDFIADVPLS